MSKKQGLKVYPGSWSPLPPLPCTSISKICSDLSIFSHFILTDKNIAISSYQSHHIKIISKKDVENGIVRLQPYRPTHKQNNSKVNPIFRPGLLPPLPPLQQRRLQSLKTTLPHWCNRNHPKIRLFPPQTNPQLGLATPISLQQKQTLKIKTETNLWRLFCYDHRFHPRYRPRLCINIRIIWFQPPSCRQKQR